MAISDNVLTFTTVGGSTKTITLPDSGGTVTVKVTTNKSGETVTAKSGSYNLSATSNSSKIATFSGLVPGSSWTFTFLDFSRTITLNTTSVSLDLSHISMPISSVNFSMSFVYSTWKSDPKACLTYSGDCVGYTPVSTPPSSLGACTVLGSWSMNADGSSSNPLLASCFYATFDEDGYLHELLNPLNLARKIGEWDRTYSVWRTASGSSSIETENTMFCFPALYRGYNSGTLTIGTTSASGTAYGATIDGHTYQYEAIGVYEGYVNGSKLMSLSGKPSTGSVTRPNFRTYAAANPVQNGKAMLWNFHQWRDWWHLALFAMKSWNSQVAVGQGGFPYDTTTGQGLCNAMGPFAGSTSTTPSASTSVKCLIENPWGYKTEFIDDFVNCNDYAYVGQNSTPDDTTDNKEMKSSPNFTSSTGWGSDCLTNNTTFWGMPRLGYGSSTTCTCDIFAGDGDGYNMCSGIVGGSSGGVSNGYAGMSCLYVCYSLAYSGAGSGARLAFVFDIDTE